MSPAAALQPYVLCPETFANVAPPETTVPLLVVGHVGSLAAEVPATVQRITHWAFGVEVILRTNCPTV
jgi:hypothetical protein